MALTTGVLFAAVSLAAAGTVGDARLVDTAGGWNPDVVFDTEHDVYLVVWAGAGICGRFVNTDGVPVGSTFRIDDAIGAGLYPAVAYNPSRDEFLVTWDSSGRPGQTDTIWGQRVHSPDGALVGGNFRIGTSGGVRSQVAWASVSQCYMVVNGLSLIHAQRVSGTGTLLGSEISVSNAGWYPAVSYSPGSDAFLVSWDDANPGVGAARYAAATGTRLDSVFPVSPAVADRSHSTHDDGLGRWLVQYQDQSHPGQSYDQYVRFVNDNGSLGPGPFPAASTTEFEGETILGCDIAFSAKGGFYFSSFGTNYGISGQLLSRDGYMLRGQVTLGSGNYTFHSNAADSSRDRFLTVYSGGPLVGDPWRVYCRLYRVYAPVTGLTTADEPGRIRLNWTQPDDSDMTRVTIRFSTTGTPAGPNDGSLAATLDVTPGTVGTFLHTGLDHQLTYYYAVFAHGYTAIYAPGVPASDKPTLPGDLDHDEDVDQSDFGVFQACLVETGTAYQPGCEEADYEPDGDVDQNDLAVFQNCMGGSDSSPGC